MKKLILLLTIFLGLATGYLMIQQSYSAESASDNQLTSPVESISPIVLPSPDIEVEPVSPSQLRIPKLSISSDVEWVGLDEEKRMDVPQADENVAWYELGVRPGEIGSAVIAGHYDKLSGGPAVFYELTELETGDIIEVVGEGGEALDFRVTRTAMYQDATFPIEEVFSRTDGRRLNLITCAGRFDQAARNYSDRFVVFTELVE